MIDNLVPKYLNTTKFLDEYNKSSDFGYINDELDKIYNTLIIYITDRYPIVDEYRKMYQWSCKENIINNWDKYNTELNKNPYPYYNNIIKRQIHRLFNKNINELKKEYYEYNIQMRKEKILKIKEIICKKKIPLN